MNNGRIWCVVNPTVGLPLFLGSVALMSFTVHFAVLNNTTWVADFFKGKSKTMTKAEGVSGPVALKTDSGGTVVINVVPSGSGDVAKHFVVTVTPQAIASVVDGPPGGTVLAAKLEQ